MNQERLPPSAYDNEDIERHYNNFEVGRGRYRFILDELKPQSKILEVGCFLGRYCDYFKSQGHDPIGIDLSSKVIEEGKKLFPNLDLRVTSGEMDREFDQNQFDAVIASEVIEHVLHPDEFLKQIVNVLKPGGRLLLTTQNSNAIHYRLRMLVGKFRWDPTHLRLYSKPELMQEIEGSGLKITKMKGIPINPIGPQWLVRQFAYYSTFLNPNFCWTWGVVAEKK